MTMADLSKKIILAILPFALLACGGKPKVSEPPSGKVTISRIEETDDKGYTVTLNGVLAVAGVKVKDGKNGKTLIFPQPKGKDSKFPFIRVSRGDADFMVGQLEGTAETSETPQGFEITKTEVKLHDDPKLKAFVEFELNGGAVKLSSWKIFIGKKGPFLGVPSEKSGEDWKEVVFTVDEDFNKALLAAAMKEYEAQGGSIAPEGADAATDTAVVDTGI